MPSLSAPIKTRKEYDDTLALLVKLLNEEDDDHPHPDIPNLLSLVKAYEDEQFPIGFPDALSAIKFEMDQSELSVKDLAPCFGSIRKARDVLAGRSKLTLSMARSLHEEFQIPADVLLGEPGKTFNPKVPVTELKHFPWNEIVKRGWVTKWKSRRERFEEMFVELARLELDSPIFSPAFLRETGRFRAHSNPNHYSVQAWCMQVANLASDNPAAGIYISKSVTREFMREVAFLSIHPDGPLQAREYLSENGISLVIEPHLAKTYLDGAAFRLSNGRPVIGLTLRYDRLDNFWFTLMHELAHVSLHLDEDMSKMFFDELDFSVTDLDVFEREADKLAMESLIPSDMWESSDARFGQFSSDAYQLADEARIHPAIVVGRIRYENNNYANLSELVGRGKVRELFLPAP